MVFRPGESGNPKGRAPGTRNRKTLAAGQAIDAVATKDKNGRKVVDPYDLLQSIVSSAETNAALRITAATALLPYLYLRKTARYIDRAFDLPLPGSVEDAARNIGELTSRAARGEIGLDECEMLVSASKSYIEARVGLEIEGQMLELRQVVERLQASARPIDAVVVGGLGPLPGTRIEMPALANGNGEPGDAE
jgi:hypothetical protein